MLQGLLSLHAAARLALPLRELDEPGAPEGSEHGVCPAARQQASTPWALRVLGALGGFGPSGPIFVSLFKMA